MIDWEDLRRVFQPDEHNQSVQISALAKKIVGEEHGQQLDAGNVFGLVVNRDRGLRSLFATRTIEQCCDQPLFFPILYVESLTPMNLKLANLQIDHCSECNNPVLSGDVVDYKSRVNLCLRNDDGFNHSEICDKLLDHFFLQGFYVHIRFSSGSGHWLYCRKERDQIYLHDNEKIKEFSSTEEVLRNVQKSNPGCTVSVPILNYKKINQQQASGSSVIGRKRNSDTVRFFYSAAI